MKKSFRLLEIGEALQFINESIAGHRLKKNEETRASLMSEETLLLMRDHASEDEITISVTYFNGTLMVKMSARGIPFDPFGSTAMDPMQAALMQSFADDIRFRHHRGTLIVAKQENMLDENKYYSGS